MTTPTRFGPTHLAIAGATCLILGLNLVAMKILVDASSPLWAVIMRMSLVLVCCAAFLRPVPGKTATLALFGAINGGVFSMLMNTSLRLADNVSALAIVGQLGIPFSVILGVIFLREKLSRDRLIGLLLAFGGVATLMFDPRITSEVPGALVMMCGSAMFAVGSLLQRKLAGVHVLNLMGWNALMALIVVLPFALTLEGAAMAKLTHLPWQAYAAVGFAAIFTSVIGQGSLAWLIQRFPLSMVMPLILATPVVSALVAWAYFRTPFTAQMAIGGLIALTGVTIVSRANMKS